MENQTTEIPEKVIGQVISQYKTFGVGYDKHDPELTEALHHLGKVVKFLSRRCVGDTETISLMHKVAAISEELNLFTKMQKGGKAWKDENHPDGMFEKGFDYWWREVRVMKSCPLVFKKMYNY